MLTPPAPIKIDTAQKRELTDGLPTQVKKAKPSSKPKPKPSAAPKAKAKPPKAHSFQEEGAP